MKNFLRIKTLGDPHLGRPFVHGVPLRRRGERERMVAQAFVEGLRAEDIDLHVCMGDLFDKRVVPLNVILFAARRYMEAAQAWPNAKFVVLSGNHDISRDVDQISAFDVFKAIVGQCANIQVVTDFFEFEGHHFYGWKPFEQLPIRPGAEAVFGHWDTSGFGDNQIPTKAMQQAGVSFAYTGHVHKPANFTQDGIRVVGTGSMQPYGHGEQVNDELYLTMPLQEVMANPSRFTKKCLRVDLSPDQVLDEDIDCLQLTLRYLSDDTAAASEPVVTFGAFNMEDLFDQAFEAENVPLPIREEIYARYRCG